MNLKTKPFNILTAPITDIPFRPEVIELDLNKPTEELLEEIGSIALSKAQELQSCGVWINEQIKRKVHQYTLPYLLSIPEKRRTYEAHLNLYKTITDLEIILDRSIVIVNFIVTESLPTYDGIKLNEVK